jgi:hypothetical protein
MPVLHLESASLSGTVGAPGDSPSDGNHYMDQRTLDGPGPSHLSSLSTLLTPFSPAQTTSSYTATIQVSSRVGTSAETTTRQSMTFSSISMLFLAPPFAFTVWQPATSPVKTTKLMTPPEASMETETSCYLSSHYRNTLESFLWTPRIHDQHENSENSGRGSTCLVPPEPSTSSTLDRRQLREPEHRPSSRTSWSSTSSKMIDSSPAHFDSPLLAPTDTRNSTFTIIPKPRLYPPNLHPLPSLNCLHCLMRGRL